MKKTKMIVVLTLFCTTLSVLRAQTLEEALKNSLTKIEAAKTEQEITAASSQFDRIANKWSDQWVANYYAAYSKIIVSFKLTDKTKRDQNLDVANVYLEKAQKLSPDNQEIFILGAWSAKARISIDGADRWKKYGEVYDEYISKAKKINPENPRIYFLEGQGPFYKPKLYGGGKNKAKPYFEKAKKLFDKEDKSNVLVPSWGGNENEALLKQCEE
jgi:hypothetical protein